MVRNRLALIEHTSQIQFFKKYDNVYDLFIILQKAHFEICFLFYTKLYKKSDIKI